MKFPQILGFLKLLSESIKLVLKNVKVIAPITALSLLLSSILFLLFNFFYQSFMAYITNIVEHSSSLLPVILLLAPIFAVEFTLLLAFIAIAQVCGITTVIATATSYTGGHSRILSLQDLYATLKAKWRSPFKTNHFRQARNPMHLLGIVAVAVAVPIVTFYPNPITIAIVGVVGVAMSVFQMYASVAWALAAVIPVVEDGCEAAEAMERAEKLVEGQRLDGFMVSLLFNIVWLIIFFSLWKIVGVNGSINLAVYGVFFVSSVLAIRISMSVVFTVYYFHCKEYHGDKIPLSGNFNFHYTTLINDIP